MDSKMTKKDYLERHIAHRLELLTTFRNRFKNETDESIEDKNLGDLYKCSKDISILMIRFFSAELGLKLKQGSSSLRDLDGNRKDDKIILDRMNKFSIEKLSENDIPLEVKDKLITCLTIANRAVSHIDEGDVNHKLERHRESKDIMNPVIDFIEKTVNSNMF